MGFLTDEDRAGLIPAEDLPHGTPIPTQTVSSDEYFPPPQSAKQRELEARLLDLGDRLAERQGRAGVSSRPRPAWPQPTSP